MNPDVELNEIGVLKRREIEARILGPILDTLAREFGKERVFEIVRQAIVEIAKQQGAELADSQGGGGIDRLMGSIGAWTRDDALRLTILEQDEKTLSFNVTRCLYAEMYQRLGVPELGAILSCCRDFSFVQGFDPNLELTRTQTIMQGAEYCDFRYQQKPPDKPK